MALGPSCADTAVLAEDLFLILKYGSVVEDSADTPVRSDLFYKIGFTSDTSLTQHTTAIGRYQLIEIQQILPWGHEYYVDATFINRTLTD